MIRKVSNICFNRVEIEKAIASNHKPSVFFTFSHKPSGYFKGHENKKPERNDIQLKGSVLKNRSR